MKSTETETRRDQDRAILQAMTLSDGRILGIAARVYDELTSGPLTPWMLCATLDAEKPADRASIGRAILELVRLGMAEKEGDFYRLVSGSGGQKSA